MTGLMCAIYATLRDLTVAMKTALDLMTSDIRVLGDYFEGLVHECHH